MSKKDNVNVLQFSIFKRIQIKLIGKSKQKKFAGNDLSCHPVCPLYFAHESVQ